MATNIKEFFIFDNYKIVVFKATSHSVHYSISSGSGILYWGSGANKKMRSIDLDFERSNISVLGYKVLGRLSELTDDKCMVIFNQSRYKDSHYPNFNTDGDKLDSPLDSLKSYLKAQQWMESDVLTWIIIPVPTKKITGKKIDIEFWCANEDFTTIVKQVLTVYMSPITKETKEIKYTVEIPDYLYDYTSLHPVIETRPKFKTITSTVFSELHSKLQSISNDAINLKRIDNQMATAKKILVIEFNSKMTPIRDNYFSGFAGNKTAINYHFFVGYKLRDEKDIYVSNRWVNGKIEPVTGRMAIVSGIQGVVIEWTQEREDELTRIENGFKNLSDALNHVMKDMDGDKLDAIITNRSMNILPENITTQKL